VLAWAERLIGEFGAMDERLLRLLDVAARAPPHTTEAVQVACVAIGHAMGMVRRLREKSKRDITHDVKPARFADEWAVQAMEAVEGHLVVTAESATYSRFRFARLRKDALAEARAH
jgi:hypothetical protein